MSKPLRHLLLGTGCMLLVVTAHDLDAETFLESGTAVIGERGPHHAIWSRFSQYQVGYAFEWLSEAGHGNALLEGVRNKLNQGQSYHLQMDHRDSYHFFLWENTFTNSAGLVEPFVNPLSTPVHYIR